MALVAVEQVRRATPNNNVNVLDAFPGYEIEYSFPSIDGNELV
jgi:hypothetical protein